MNFLQSILYGIVSGLSEFLPVSSQAHERLLRHLFGFDYRDPALDLFIDIAVLLAVITSCRTFIQHARREHRRINTRSARKATRRSQELRLIKHASIPMILGLLCTPFISHTYDSLLLVGLGLLLNSVSLLIPCYTLQGNKTARSMSLVDSLLIGFGGAFSVFPGISRIGAMVSVAIMRGANRQHGLNWAFLLSIPAFAVLIALDVFAIFTQSFSFSFIQLFYSLLSAASAYVTAYYAIVLMRHLTVKNTYSIFAYYTFGVALFAYVLYLIV